MNDSRINALVRMAGEAEELERSAEAPLAMPGAGRVVVPSRWSIVGPLAALAACATIAVGIVMWPTGQTGTEPEAGGSADALAVRTVKGPEKRVVPAAPVAITLVDESSIVLAIVEDPDGDVQCVSWTRHAPGEADHHGMAPADLARRMCRADCVPGPHWLLAAKVTGPESSLPSCDDQMQALAACILEEHGERCDAGPRLMPAGSAQCVPVGVRVVVERRSLAMP